MAQGKLAGRVALVTGAGSGIGRAIATIFAEEGATVVVNDLREAAAQTTVDELAALGAPPAHPVVADVASSAQVREMFDTIVQRFGRLDVLVNNAGMAEGEPGEQTRVNEQAEAVMADTMNAMMSGAPRTVHWDIASQITDESWSRMIAVHLSGTFYCCRAAIPVMAGAGSGSIINISSIGGIIGQPGVPHYAAAKAGILGLTRRSRVSSDRAASASTPSCRARSRHPWPRRSARRCGR